MAETVTEIVFKRGISVYPNILDAKTALSQLPDWEYGKPVSVKYLTGDGELRVLLAVGNGDPTTKYQPINDYSSEGVDIYLNSVSGNGNGTVTFNRNELAPIYWDASHKHTVSEIKDFPELPFLPLAAGSEFPLTGDLYCNERIIQKNNKGFSAYLSNATLVEIMKVDNTDKLIIGSTSIPTQIVTSEGDIMHVIGSNSYKIWDERNFTPGNYYTKDELNQTFQNYYTKEELQAWIEQQGFLTEGETDELYAKLEHTHQATDILTDSAHKFVTQAQLDALAAIPSNVPSFNASWGYNGHAEIDHLCIQWGHTTVTGNSRKDVTFPTRFSVVYSITGAWDYTDLGSQENWGYSDLTESGFKITNGEGTERRFNWIAIGYK